MRGGANRDAPRTVPIERKLPFLNLNAPLENGEHYFFKKLLHRIALISILNPRAWWVWPSWLRRQIVALEIEGSSPFTHPSAPEKKFLHF